MRISEITRYPIMKMHGCGNDFVVMTDFNEQLTPEQAKRICDRHFGVGSDGLIAVLNSRVPEARFRMKFFNPDGTTAEMCGNGIRCFAKYVVDQGLEDCNMQQVDTDKGIVKPHIVAYSGAEAKVKVDMGEPVLYNPKQVTVKPESEGVVRRGINIDGHILDFTYVCMGNPHAVIFRDYNTREYAKTYGERIETNREVFPQKTNVEFVKVNSPEDLTMYVWERGAGETLACGTGACASLVASVLNGHSKDHAKLHLLGGDLDISWDGKGNPVYMTGPARNVYRISTKSLDKYLFSRK